MIINRRSNSTSEIYEINNLPFSQNHIVLFFYCKIIIPIKLQLVPYITILFFNCIIDSITPNYIGIQISSLEPFKFILISII